MSGRYATGKLDNAVKEAKDMRIDIIGLSEIRWTGCDRGRVQEKYKKKNIQTITPEE